MYREKMISVGKIENGFLLEVRVPFKKEKKEDDDEKCCVMGMGYGEKEIFAKDAATLAKTIETLIPMLDTEFGADSEFEAAFKKADI